jgi:hypothetical protein
MSKIKHNKKRNVGIIYELLVRNMTRALVSENISKVNKIKALIEKHFNKSTELYQEYRIFNALSNGLKNSEYSRETATALLNESKKVCNKINSKKLEREKSFLIKEINYSFGKKFYFEHIPNYVDLATIQIVMNEWKKDNFNIKDAVMLEEKVISSLVNAKKEDQYTNLTESINNTQSDKIVMNIMTKKINEKYNHMSNDQKNLIKSYAFFFEKDKDRLISYLSEQKNKSVKLLEGFKEKNESAYLDNKINTVISNVKSINENNLSDDTIIKFLTVSQLISELSSEE